MILRAFWGIDQSLTRNNAPTADVLLAVVIPVAREALVAHCITCGTELHPERAARYDYCLAPKCQEINRKGLTMVGIGMNKAAEEYLILDDQTREDLASGKYRDQRRGSFGPPAPAAGPRPEPGSATGAGGGAPKPRRPSRATAAPRPPWTRSQQKLALLYNQQGLRPDEIAAKLGVSARLVTQIILAAKNRGKA